MYYIFKYFSPFLFFFLIIFKVLRELAPLLVLAPFFSVLFKITNIIFIKTNYSIHRTFMVSTKRCLQFSEFVVYFSVSILNINITPSFPFHIHCFPKKTKIQVSLKTCKKKTCLSLKHGQVEMEVVWARVYNKIKYMAVNLHQFSYYS